MDAMENLRRQMEKMTPEQREQLIKDSLSLTKKYDKFIPNPGPQTEAMFHPADIMLYGGEAGGGKTALGCGLALTSHTRSLLLRRQFADLSAMTEQLLVLHGSREGFVASPHPRLRTKDKFIEFGACQLPGDEQSYQGHAHDLKYFDEVTQFLESQVRFICGWNRQGPGVPESQRCRIMFGSNPPTDSTGDWIIGYFRPWLDPAYHNPAKVGEIRWCVTDPDGNDMWVDGPEPVQFPGRDKPTKPRSRTFIRARLSDNPYLVKSDYASVLDSLQEPLRSALRDGNFMLARTDSDNQLFPTKWLRAAQDRWRKGKPEGIPMCAIAADVSGAGTCDSMLAARYDYWYAPLIVVSGKDHRDGVAVTAALMMNRKDEAQVIVDMGGGWGGTVKLHLDDNGIPFFPYKGGNPSHAMDVSGQYGFVNVRSEAYWRFREALDPEQSGGAKVAIPADDQELFSELSAIKFEIVRHDRRMCVKLEAKDKLIKKLGKSPDRADTLIMAWYRGRKNVETEPGSYVPSKRKIKVNLGYANRK